MDNKLYTISTKRKKVYCNDLSALGKQDREKIAFYIKECGFELADKIKTNNPTVRINKATVYHYFAAREDADGLKQFKADADAKIIDKNGVEKKGGFIKARINFMERYGKDIDVVAELTDDEKDWVASIIG